MWHVLDARSIWIQEFTSALGHLTPTLGWIPRFEWAGLAKRQVVRVTSRDPEFEGREFPLQRGYARAPLSWFACTGSLITEMLSRHDPAPSTSPLVCTTPYYADVAERWPGPVIYYLTDLTVAYDGADPDLVRRLDRRLCSRATLVCANSRRIADYCERDAGCDPQKVTIVPNATRAANVTASPLYQPLPLPSDISDLPRPVLGIIGNLADNMDWAWLEESVRLIPDCSWAFVGPTSMTIANAERRAARQRLIDAGGRVRFTGMRRYGVLRDYARSFDAAVLPYRKQEPTFSGSCTRFYEHLAACRPIYGTRGFAELLEKPPLISLVDTPQELAGAIDGLRRRGMRDGFEEQRWHAAHDGTWESRAAMMVEALRQRALWQTSARAPMAVRA